MNYDGTNANIVYHGLAYPRDLLTICVPNEDFKTTFTMQPSTSEYIKDLDTATAASDKGDVVIDPCMYY